MLFRSRCWNPEEAPSGQALDVGRATFDREQDGFETPSVNLPASFDLEKEGRDVRMEGWRDRRTMVGV